jgi:hypothetical protein
MKHNATLNPLLMNGLKIINVKPRSLALHLL